MYSEYHVKENDNVAFASFIAEDEKIQELSMSFTRHPQPLAAPLNDDVNFECSLNIPAERFAWHHRPLGSNKWTPVSSPNIGGKTSRHVVTFDNESKAGDYRCIAFFGESPGKLILHILSIIHSVLSENYTNTK